MPKHHPSSPEFQSALNRFFSYSKDLNIIFSHFSQTNPPQSSYSFPSKKKSHRKRPTARSVTWRQQRIAATTPAATASPEPRIPIPTGRSDVLRHLIQQSGALRSTDDSFVSSPAKPRHVLVLDEGGDGSGEEEGVELELREAQEVSEADDELYEEEVDCAELDTDPDYFPSDDTLDGSSSEHSSDSSNIYTSDVSSEGDYDSDQPYGPASVNDLDSDHYADQSDEEGSVSSDPGLYSDVNYAAPHIHSEFDVSSKNSAISVHRRSENDGNDSSTLSSDRHYDHPAGISSGEDDQYDSSPHSEDVDDRHNNLSYDLSSNPGSIHPDYHSDDSDKDSDYVPSEESHNNNHHNLSSDYTHYSD